MAVAEILLSGDLQHYYKQRDGASIRPTQETYTQWDKPNAAYAFVKIIGDSQENDHLAEAHFYVEGMHCTACAWLIEKHLAKLSGVKSAKMQFQQAELTIQFMTNQCRLSQLMQAINEIGYSPYPYQEDEIHQAQQKHTRQKLKTLGITGLLTMQLMMLALGIYAGDFLGISMEYRHLLSVFSLLFALPLCFFAVKPFLQSALIALKQKQFNMDVNISLALLGLMFGSFYAVLSQQGDIYFDSMGMLAFFILLARYIEGQARQQLQFKKPILPFHVQRIENGQIEKIILQEVKVGDYLLIKPGETIAADGIVTEGFSSVSESVLTGEPKALDKQIGDYLFAGSINHDGQLQVKVTQAVDQTRLAKIQQACKVDLADNNAFVNDQYTRLFTLVIAVLSIMTYCIWLWLAPDSAFYVALSVLVVSCPCALSLAKPTAISATLFSLRKLGILVRSSEILEKLVKIEKIFMDKTGTLTYGEPKLTEICPVGEVSADTMLIIAAALESHSEHPLAKGFQDGSVQSAKNVHIEVNQGVEGDFNNQRYRIGSPLFCQAWHSKLAPPDDLRQIVGLCSESAFLGWFFLEDTLRDSVKVNLSQLKTRFELMIISGDQSLQVDNIAETLAVEFIKGCSSLDKQQMLKQSEQANKAAMMIGDGLNDALSFRSSSVSVTFDNASDWMKNQTDIIILQDDFNALVKIINYADQYHKIVRQNSFWAIAYNIIAIPIAMSGLITPLWAALGMSLSSILVVMNARRISKGQAI